MGDKRYCFKRTLSDLSLPYEFQTKRYEIWFVDTTIFCQLSLWAQAIDLNVHDPQQRIGKSITYFEDKTSILSVHDLQNIYEKGQCLHGSSPILNFGNTSSAIWIHIPLKSSVNAIDYLIIDNANIEQVDLYIPASNGWNTLTAGSLTKPTSGVRSTFQYIFPLQLSKPNIITNVWLRVKSRNIMLVPLKLARADNLYLIENETPKIIELCFIGFLCALLIFHLFLYLSIKDAAYLYYCLYICSLGIYTIGYLGEYRYASVEQRDLG